MAETMGWKNYFLNLDTPLDPEVEPLQRVTNSRNGLSVCVEPLIDASGVNREVRYGFSQDLQPRVGTERRNQTNAITAYSLLLQVLGGSSAAQSCWWSSALCIVLLFGSGAPLDPADQRNWSKIGRIHRMGGVDDVLCTVRSDRSRRICPLAERAIGRASFARVLAPAARWYRRAAAVR